MLLQAPAARQTGLVTCENGLLFWCHYKAWDRSDHCSHQPKKEQNAIVSTVSKAVLQKHVRGGLALAL